MTRSKAATESEKRKLEKVERELSQANEKSEKAQRELIAAEREKRLLRRTNVGTRDPFPKWSVVLKIILFLLPKLEKNSLICKRSTTVWLTSCFTSTALFS